MDCRRCNTYTRTAYLCEECTRLLAAMLTKLRAYTDRIDATHDRPLRAREARVAIRDKIGPIKGGARWPTEQAADISCTPRAARRFADIRAALDLASDALNLINRAAEQRRRKLQASQPTEPGQVTHT